MLAWRFWVGGLVGVAGLVGSARAQLTERDCAQPHVSHDLSRFRPRRIQDRPGPLPDRGPHFDQDGAIAGSIRSATRRCAASATSRWANFQQALQHYTAALQLFVTFSDWMTKVQFPGSDPSADVGARKTVPWGVSTRQAQLGQYPAHHADRPGADRPDGRRPAGRGVHKAGALSGRAGQEIVRSTALAIRRRATAAGARQQARSVDPERARRRSSAGPVRPITGRKRGSNLELGLALAAARKATTQAVPYLQRAAIGRRRVRSIP